MTEQPAAPKVLPITLGKPHEILPRRYRIIKSTVHCKSCGTNHETSQVFAYNELFSRMGQRIIMHLTPVDEILYNLPVELVNAPVKIVPVCHECIGTASFAHLPDPTSWEKWKKIYSVVQEAPKTARRAAATPKTIDDLLNI